MPPQRLPESELDRHEILYRDSELRHQRWLARSEEKRRKEEELRQSRLANTCNSRQFDEDSFLNWYESQIKRYFATEQKRRTAQRSEQRQRLMEELAQCSFAPKHAPLDRPFSPGPGASRLHAPASTGKQAPSPPLSPWGADTGRHLEPKEQLEADELVSAQVSAMETLRALDNKEQEQRLTMRRGAVEGFAVALEENAKRVEQFASTPAGRETIAERCRNFLEANPGLDERIAMYEARTDVLCAFEEKLRTDMAAALLHRARRDTQRLQVARLRVVRELVEMQKRYEDMLRSGPAAVSTLQQFDAKLLSRVKAQPWYREAQAMSARLKHIESEEIWHRREPRELLRRSFRV